MKGTLKIMGMSGHDSLEWDTEAPQTVDVVQAKFSALILAGFLGFARTPDGPTMVDEFNPAAESILLTPPLAGG